jgi:hypothetical protein
MMMTPEPSRSSTEIVQPWSCREHLRRGEWEIETWFDDMKQEIETFNFILWLSLSFVGGMHVGTLSGNLCESFHLEEQQPFHPYLPFERPH